MLLVLLSLSGIGCEDAVFTLGKLPSEGSVADERKACRDGGSLLDGSATACRPTKPHDAGETGDRPDAAGGGPLDDAALALRDAADDRIDACAPRRARAERRGLGLLLLVDDSLSVVLQPAWGQVTDAITHFVEDPANLGVGVGIQYFGSSCVPDTYAKPVVPISPLPVPARAIESSYPLPISGKAITPALTGGLSYATSVALAEDLETAVVLVSDGILDPGCASTAETASSVAHAGLAANPSVKTFVVGLGAGPSLIHTVGLLDLAPLDQVAAAGGTDYARRVSIDLGSNAELTGALNAIAKAASPCAFRLPEGFDIARVSLEWQPDSGPPATELPHIARPDLCGGGPGVYPSASPGYVELCPAACAAVRAAPPGVVTAVERCR
jgi:hypothetical protein